MVLFFPHLCICQNSEWLKICWLGFSTHHQRQLAAISNVFFPKMRNRRAEKTISSFEISHAAFSPMHPWKIGRLLIMLFFPSLSFASRYKVYEFNNCSWSVVASSIASSNPRHTHFLPLSMKNRGNYWAHPNPNACCTLHTNSLATFRHFPINCSINIQPRAILLHSKSPYYICANY